MTPSDPPKRKRLTPVQVIETVVHPSRWALLQALDEPKTAQTLAPEVNLSVANVIYHMRFLKEAGVVRITQDPTYKSRQVYHRKGFLAEIVVDYEKPGTSEATFSRAAIKKGA
jgi:hypothetical protein